MTGEGIFQGQDGRQIKFFIQKNLEAQTILGLQSHITENGGRVETKVPIQGYILIEPRSPEGERLIDCWESSERPLRNFVSYTFVAACLEADKLIPQVFRKHGKALKFHIHPSITNENVINVLRERIWNSGGDALASELEANVIIADERTPTFQALIERFDHFHDTFVEGIHWVKHCVESGMYNNTPIIKKNLGGRIAGAKRTEFTPQDDNFLAKYIACRLPDPDMRGRTGNKVYQELVARTDLYPWAGRHSWQSWRERYKNNPARFNGLIATYLEDHHVPESGKGLHGFVRAGSFHSQSKQPGAVPSESPSKELVGEVDKSEDEWGSHWSIKEGNKSPPPWGRTKRKADRDGIEESNRRKKHIADHNGEHRQNTKSTCKTLSELPKPQCPHELTHMNISDGDTPKARGQIPGDSDQTISNEDDDAAGDESQTLLDASKTMLASSRHSSRVASNPPEKNRPREPDSANLAVDLPITLAHCESDNVRFALRDVARECRFLLDEVKEEYEELGRDLDATRSYFKEIRAWINDKKSTRTKFPG